ncbi:MAG: beta-lactamase family protein [Saprospiraceae bacterium]|nr:beta-lactamase family protein [Saprospiraceae bacterium]
MLPQILRKASYTLLAILISQSASSLSAQEITSGTISKLSSYLEKLEENGQSGIALVAHSDRVLLEKGFGLANESEQIPVRQNTIFTTGSITKQFTGAAILQLEIQGKLNVEDLLSKYFENVPQDKKGITLHHLLTHSSGFPGAIGDDFEAIESDGFITQAFEADLLFEPGTDYEYSNVGYSILAILVERLSRMTYEAYLRQHFFAPLGMDNTGYKLMKWKEEDLAQGYRDGQHWGTLMDRPWAKEGPGWHLRGNGGIMSTAHDMYKWYKALYDNEIFTDVVKSRFFGRHVEEGKGAGTYYGYGWAIYPTPRGTDLVTHNGGNGIFFCEVLQYFEEDLFIFFATNRSSRGINQTAFHLARMIFEPSFDPPVPGAKRTSLQDFPKNPKGNSAKKMVEAVLSEDDQIILSYIKTYMSSEILAKKSAEELGEIFHGLREEIGERELSNIIDAGDHNLELVFSAPGVSNLYLIPEMDEKGIIQGISVEVGD